MARRYWIKVDGQKITDSAMRTLAHAKAAAQAIATRLRRDVEVGYDDIKPRPSRQLQPNPVGRRRPMWSVIEDTGWRDGRQNFEWTLYNGPRGNYARITHGFTGTRGRAKTAIERAKKQHGYRWDEPGVRIGQSMRRNPDPGSYLDVWRQQEIGRRARLDRNAATKPRRLAKGHKARGARKAAPTFRVDVNNEAEAWTFAAPTRAAANALARQYRSAGFHAEVSEA